MDAGVLVPVLPGSKNFDNSIRPPLQNSYMYKESKQSFRYNSAFLINNATLQERYEAFRTKRRDMGYTEEEMEESYGFLLFDDENKANRVGETGVVPGHSTCTTLGDPSKGVYVSKYSDCLDLNRWYHGKSGYIAIIRLTKGRVREVTENYTVNYTSPSNGFDCHVSEQLSSVSANTSSFLAFERTQYYMYELPVGGAVQPPSHVCPFAVVAFSYWDTKTPASEDKEKSEEEKTVFHYYPWRGQLQISSQIYHVGLKSSTGPLIPAKLPTMMSVDGAIPMSDLRQKLPKAIFETCFSGEVSLEGMGCSLYELSPSEAEDTSLSQLTQGLKEKDLALTIQLNDNGFLILLHSSHFLTYEDTGSSKPEVLQGMFVFPDSRAIHRDTKVCWKKPFLSPECLQVVPALNYAETEVEKCLPSPSGELRGLLEQHIQSYASLIHPGLTISPSREASIFPDQFDVPDALKYLYSAPKWTEMGWKRLKSYFHQPGSFELSVSRATELLVAGREERGDEPDDDVYYCLSSPEGSPMSPASLGGPEEQQSGGKSPGDTADTAADFSKALAVSMEDFEKPGKTMEDINAPDKAVKEGNNLLLKEVRERLPSDLSKPLIPAEDFAKPGLNKAPSKAPVTTLPPKEVQEELTSDLSQTPVSADDSEKPGKTKADCNAPGVRTEDEGTSLIPEEVEVDEQEKVHSDLLEPVVSAEDSRKPALAALGKADCNAPEVGVANEETNLYLKEVQKDMPSGVSQLPVSAEVLRKADLAALGKADCNAPEVGVAKEETNLYLKEVQKDMPSGVSQPPVSAEVLRKPSPALATKPNSKAPEAGVEDNMKTLPQKEVQEEVPSDLSQLAVSAKAFGIASMRVMKKATEVTEVSTSPASGNLPTVLVITATERTATVLPHNESTTNNSSSLPCAKLQDKGGSALNGQRGKANQPSKPTEVSHSSISDWRKRPRKRHRFSGLCKRILRSTVADFEEKEKEDMESMDSSEVYLLKKRKERMDLIKVNPLQKEERMDVTQVRPLKMPRELMNLIQDPPLKKKEKMDVTQVHPLKMPRELMNLIQDPPLKMKNKDLIHYHPLRNKESMDLIHDDHPLKKKTERWDLKAIISECGRIFVPHGSEVIAKDIESLKVKGKVLDHKQCADEMMVEACIKVPQPIETGDGPNLELNKSDENKDFPIGMLDSEDSLHEVKMADVGKMASLNPSELLLNKDTDSPSSGKHKKKRQYVAISLSQLKTVLSRGGKRNKPINPAPEDQTSPVNKKSKADTPGMDEMENVNINKANPDRTTGAVEVAKEQTFGLDPKFALALGLTPTELNNDAHKSPEKSDIPLKKDIQSRLDLVPPQATSDQTSEALPSSPSTTIILASQRRPFKKKHEHADSIRKKWWLHYRSPAALERETVAISSQLVTLDPDVSRVVSRGRPCEGASAVSCPPAESLTLLADLARSTSNDKVLEQQSDPKALEKQDDHPSLVISDNSVKDGISPHDPDGEPEFVLPALLKHPSAARLKLPPQSPSPKGLVVGSGERVVLVSQEHSYSLPPSSLLLGLSGSIVQVPISEGLQQHRKDIFADGTQTLRAFLYQQKDQNGKEPGLARESLSRGIRCRQKFHRFRRFIEKDGSVQVTRLWKENYNFNSDSKFTNDPKDKTVIRALHGPWDFDIKDTKEQVQLIIHMWIGLFYSRSTARFCQADSSLTCLEKKDSIEVAHGMVPAQVPPGTKTSSPAYIDLSRIPEPDVLDLSKMGQKKAQPLSLEAEVLDLSMKTTSTVLDSLDTESKRRIDLKNHPSYLPATGLHKETISCPKQSTSVELKVYRDRVDSVMSERSSDLGDDEDYETNNHENDSKGTLQNGVSPYERTLESDRSYILLCEQAASVYIHHKKLLETQTAQVLEGNNKKLLETQTAQVLEDNNKKLLETQTAQVLEDNNKKLLETQTAQVLEDNNKKLLETQTAQVLEGNNKKLLQKEEEMTGDGEPNAVCLKTMGSKDVNKEQQLKDNDSVKTMPCTEVQMDGDAANMADTVERNANEARDGAHAVICDGSESKEEMHKVDHNVKDSVEAAKPEAVHAGKDTTNKEITKAQTAVHVGKDFIDNDKALKAVHSENVPRDYGNTKDQVQTAMQDGNDTRDETLPAVICGEDSGDKTPPVVCDGNTSVAETLPEISHTENDSQKETLAVLHGGNDLRDTTLPVKCNGKLYIDVEPTVVHDINGSTDEELPMGQGGDVSAGTSRVLPEMHGEIKCKDLLPTQVFPECDGNMPFVGEFDTLIQPNNVSGVAKHEINEADVQTKEQEKELMQGQSKSDDVTTQSSTTFPPGSQHSQDETLERLTGQVEIPLIPREDIAHTDELHSIGEVSEMAQGQVEIPFIGVEIPFIGLEKNSQDINHTEVHDTHPSQKETLITVCDSANVLSGEMLAKIFSKGTESVSRCPTVDEVLYGYIPIPDICSASLAICDADGVSKPLRTGEGYGRCPTPTEDEPPFVPGFSYDHHTPNTVLLPNAKDTNSPNLDSGLALIENEKDHHEPSLSLYKARAATGLHNLHKSSNNNKPNNLEAIDNRFSQVLADPRKNPIATSTPLNTPSSSLKERSDYDPYSNTRLAAVEPDLHANSSRHSLHSFSYSFPNTHCSLTEKAAFSVPSIHPEVLSNETTLTGNFSEIALERETCLRPALSELILQSTRLSIPAGSGPTAASQNLSMHSFTQPQPNSQKPAMIVNVSKSEDSRGQYNWEEGQTDIDPMSSDVLKSKQTDTPVRSNTNAHSYNTQYATEMRQIAVLQDYEDVMADEDVMGDDEDVMADDEDVMGENEAPSVDKDNIESSLETNWISDDKHLRSKFRLNKTRLDFINSLRQSREWEQREFDAVLDFNKQGTSSSVTIQSEESDKILSHMEENQQEWLKYCRAKRSGSQMDMTKEEDSSVAKPRLVTVLDHKGNRITYENYPVLKPTASMHTRTVPDSNRQGLSSFLEFSKRWDDTHNADESDLTQSSMDLETLIFSERMNQMLKRKSSSSNRNIRSRHRRSNVEERASTSSPAVTVHFSSLQEDQDGSEEHWEAIPSLAGQKIRVEMPERMAMPEETDGEPQHLKKLSCTKGSEMTHVKVSDLVVDSFRVYHAMMTEVCAGKKYPSRTERLKREDAKRNSSPKSRAPSKDKDFCGKMKEDMYDSLHDNLNSVVRQSCKNKFRFYILVTSSDPFFRETKELLEAEGHIAVEQSQFCLGKDSPLCPLHIILRNEDIAEHICEVPHLLELKKSQNVLFAGIDRPDDIVNLTHQELFSKGGFVVFEGAALHTLSLSNMKKMSGFLEGLSKKGKWKWLLHYRDSRKLKENARSSAEAQGKKIFMDICQEAGMVEVLPYHECDVISRERPNYLHCLVRLQVQNVSARLPVFITDTTADKAFAKHGIFTMNINSFLLISQSDTCTIS
ncbi:protein TASOR 2-like isoform X2 [Oncorhynchus clarkii lewisi]|uniref:protein TASOR 2-like isoform X2 n=1 Tax=Oncorhynchus clarkii lewisi TaxID=490388 RepID=UPI0039B8BB4E